MRIAAVIPVGSLEGAKTRLGEMLDAEERHDLVLRLLARTVVAALTSERLEDVLVISPDRDLLARAAELGARTLRQRGRGLNAGVRDGRDDVVAGGAEAVLVLPTDLPFVSPEAIDAVLAALPDDAARAVVLVPDRHGTGTNAPRPAAARRDRRRLRCREPPGAPPTRRGRRRRLRRAAGVAAHRRPRHARGPGLRRDDGPGAHRCRLRDGSATPRRTATPRALASSP